MSVSVVISGSKFIFLIKRTLVLIQKMTESIDSLVPRGDILLQRADSRLYFASTMNGMPLKGDVYTNDELSGK